jgi:hypothetical protein
MANDYSEYRYQNGTDNPATSFYVPTSKLQDTFYNGLDSEVQQFILITPVFQLMMLNDSNYLLKRVSSKVDGLYRSLCWLRNW